MKERKKERVLYGLGHVLYASVIEIPWMPALSLFTLSLLQNRNMCCCFISFFSVFQNPCFFLFLWTLSELNGTFSSACFWTQALVNRKGCCCLRCILHNFVRCTAARQTLSIRYILVRPRKRGPSPCAPRRTAPDT